MRGVIYKYTSPSGKVYIGQTIKEEVRKQQHKACYDDTYFHRAIKKYGYENFTYEVLFWTTSKDKNNLKVILDALERFYIRKFKSNDRKYGYNGTSGGEGTYDKVVGEETRMKLSAAAKGKHPSEETRKKLSDAMKGRFVSAETRQKKSQTTKGRSNTWAHKKVLCIETGVIYNSIKEAAKEIGCASTNISKVCKLPHRTVKGYHFKKVA